MLMYKSIWAFLRHWFPVFLILFCIAGYVILFPKIVFAQIQSLDSGNFRRNSHTVHMTSGNYQYTETDPQMIGEFITLMEMDKWESTDFPTRVPAFYVIVDSKYCLTFDWDGTCSIRFKRVFGQKLGDYKFPEETFSKIEHYVFTKIGLADLLIDTEY